MGTGEETPRAIRGTVFGGGIDGLGSAIGAMAAGAGLSGEGVRAGNLSRPVCLRKRWMAGETVEGSSAADWPAAGGDAGGWPSAGGASVADGDWARQRAGQAHASVEATISASVPADRSLMRNSSPTPDARPTGDATCLPGVAA